MTQPEQSPGFAELTTLVRDCAISGVGRRVLLLRTELLPPSLTRPHHLRLAHEALQPLTAADRARWHELTAGRVAISWRGEAAERLQAALGGLQHLLSDAPLEAPAMPDLVRLFELPKDGAALVALASNRAPGFDPDAPGPPVVEVTPPPPLDLALLGGIEARLAIANVARFARRRPVCRLVDGAFTLAWETRFLSIQELVSDLCPGRNAFADPWLFRRLTRMLDRRVLSLLSAPLELRDAGPFSLDLNVGSVLGPEFIRFDVALPASLRGHTVLDFHPADVMGDLSSFFFAAAFARARNYRVMLRAITAPLLPVLDLAALELDYVELRWSATLAGFDPVDLRAGPASWLLAQAHDVDAIRWGHAAGITLFQGDAVRPGAPAFRSRNRQLIRA